MDVREAVEEDAPRLGELADGPTDVMRNLVHDRTVRVAVETPDGDGGPDDTAPEGEHSDAGEREADEAVAAEGESDEDESDGEVVGFVSFDAREGTVHVTQLAGPPAVCERLIEEPIGFAQREGMAVELLVADDEEAIRQAAEAADFTEAGSGPRFAGTETTRYRREAEPPRH